MIYYPKNLNIIPTTPGIYKMKNKTGEIIYVGKAKHLKNRIKSYFQNKNHGYDSSYRPFRNYRNTK